MGGKTRNQNTNKQNKKIPCNHNWALCTPAGFCPLAAARCLGSMFRENQMFLKEHKHGGQALTSHTHGASSEGKDSSWEPRTLSPILCASQAFSVLFIQSLASRTTGH